MAVFSKLKQYKDLRNEAKKFKNVMSDETVHGEGAGGKVGIVMDGNQEILTVDISDELLTVERKEELQNGVKQAFSDATKKLQRVMAQKMRSGELNMPNIGQQQE